MSKPRRILICGGRDFDDRMRFEKVMHALRPFFGWPFCVINGGARGADAMAEDWALRGGHPCITMKAPWDRYGKAAGRVRNEWMLDWGHPDLVIAFPGGAGTDLMKKLAKDKGIPVYEG